jgi:hypothetical protein
MMPVQGISDSRYLGSTSGISFARVVFAAVGSSTSSNTPEHGGSRPQQQTAQQTAQTVLGMLPDESRWNVQETFPVKTEPGADEEFQLVGGGGWEGHQVREYSQASAGSPAKGMDVVGDPLEMIKPPKPELQLHRIGEIYGNRSQNLTLPALRPPSQSASAKSPDGSQSHPSLKSPLPEQLSVGVENGEVDTALVDALLLQWTVLDKEELRALNREVGLHQSRETSDNESGNNSEDN